MRYACNCSPYGNDIAYTEEAYESLRKEVERYRWLRACSAGDWERMNNVRFNEGMEVMDNTIDAILTPTPKDACCWLVGEGRHEKGCTADQPTVDPIIHAQHNETGATWLGLRSQIPVNYFECVTEWEYAKQIEKKFVCARCGSSNHHVSDCKETLNE